MRTAAIIRSTRRLPGVPARRIDRTVDGASRKASPPQPRLSAAQQPTCKNCPATYIDTSELDAYIKRAMAENIIDQQVRSIDIGRSNVAIGVGLINSTLWLAASLKPIDSLRP